MWVKGAKLKNYGVNDGLPFEKVQTEHKID